MKREEKIKKRIARAKRRKEKRDQTYRELCSELTENKPVPFSGLRRDYGDQPWPTHDSPTGWLQRCSYEGICQYPCNGDC